MDRKWDNLGVPKVEELSHDFAHYVNLNLDARTLLVFCPHIVCSFDHLPIDDFGVDELGQLFVSKSLSC